jgi:hypothetical protein
LGLAWKEVLIDTNVHQEAGSCGRQETMDQKKVFWLSMS